ncbi:MAG TPA: vWA domain-containing protein [Thermoanaerobaculia bacterium]|nr:vWA domain-containing protein [Thermoanaerobaculia bacterium]
MKSRVAIVIALVLASAQAVAGATETPGLDLVLLLDRSRSMARHDPEPFVRIAADVVARNAQANAVTHRVAVVSFASTARVERPLTPVGHSREQLYAGSRRAAGHTDVLAAFEAAARLLGERSSRRRAVLLITDGILSVPGTTTADLERALLQFVAERFRETALHVALLPHAGVRHEQFWQSLSRNRVQHVGAPAAFHAPIAGVVGTRTQESRTTGAAQRIVLPPYLASVVFDVFRGSRSGTVAVFPPGATKPLQRGAPGVEEVRLSPELSSIVVHDPAPGVWTFRTLHADGAVRIFSQEFFPTGRLINPSSARPLPRYSRAAMTYRVVNGSGQPLGELPGYPLTLDLRLVSPENRAVFLPLYRRVGMGAAVFGTNEAVDLVTVGRYWTEVRVSTLDAERRPVHIFHDRWSGFSVADGLPVDCRASIELLDRLRINCRDGRTPPAEVFRVTLSRDGQPVAAPIALHRRGAGLYEGALDRASAFGTYRLHISTPPSIRVAAREVEFVRRGPGLLSIGGTVLAALLVATLVVFRRRYPRF